MSDRAAVASNVHHLALGAVLVVAAVLRLASLTSMEFRYDSAYWAVEAVDILAGARPLLGQQVGSVSVPLHNGPLMSYLTAAGFAVAGPKPEAVAAIVALANVVGVWLTYLMARRLCRNRWCALVAPALMAVSPWFVLHSRMLWPQSLFPALMPLIWLGLTAVLVEATTWWRGLMLGICLGIGLQLHLSMLAVAGVVFVLASALSASRLRTFVAIGLGLALGYAPLIVHDVVNGFQTIGALAALPSAHASQEPWAAHAAKALWNFSNVLSGQAMWTSKLGPPSPLPLVIDWGQGVLVTGAFACASLMALRPLVTRDGRPLATRLRAPETLILVIVWIPVLYLAISSAQIVRHYFLVLFPLPFVLLAMAADRLSDAAVAPRLSRFVPVGLGAVILLNLTTIGYLFVWLSSTGGAAAYGPVLQHRAEAVAFIRADSRGAFTVDVSDTREPLPYVFLFKRVQPIAVDVDDPEAVSSIRSAGAGTEGRATRYRIVEPEFSTVPPHPRDAVWQAGGVTVERVLPLDGGH